MNALLPNALAHILIVDDEPDNRTLLDVILLREGYLTKSAASGHEALACVAELPPALILLDLMMPGMDGYQVAAQVKGNQRTRGIPILVISASIDAATIARAQAAGAEEFMCKPISRVALCDQVKRLLAGAGRLAEAPADSLKSNETTQKNER
jgi:CheY-like chemotaxis protein